MALSSMGYPILVKKRRGGPAARRRESMKKRVLSILCALALCLTLLPAAALAGDEDVHPAPGTSTTQLDPAPTTLADDPFPTLQSFVHFKYYPDYVPIVGDALNGATTGDGGHGFAWDANQTGSYGLITMNADGTYGYSLDNDNHNVQTVQPGQALTDRFTYTYTDKNGRIGNGSVTIYVPGTGYKDPEPGPGDLDKHHDGWTELTPSSDILIGNSYYLSDDVEYTGTGPIRVFNNVTLCLNGHTLDLNGKYIYLYNGASLTLCDCSDEETESGSITGGSATDGAIFVDNDGTFNMTGGNIINADNHGVYVKGAFNMKGGSITGSSDTYGGGVYVNGGTFDMEGGSIINSTADVGGGVCVTGDGNFTMSGGSITGNTADYGSGVCVNNGTFRMEDGEITDNTADYGGGVYIPNAGSFTMSGTASITDNNADENGGGVYVNGGTFNMEKGAITDNTADYGGGVFAAGKFNMEDGEITGNHADYGDGVYVFDNTFTLTGGTPSDVYLYNGQTITIGGARNHAQKIDVTMRTPGAFTIGWSTHMDGKTPTDYFTSGSPAYTIVLAGNEAALERLNAVTFLPNGGNGTMETQYFSNGEVKALTANAFVCPGYTFTGWNTQADGSGISYKDGAELTVTNDLTLYAQWTAIPSNGGSSDPTYSVSLPGKVTGGTVTAKKSYAEEGETFRFTVTPDEGWELEALTVTDNNGKELELTSESDGEYSFKMPDCRVEIEVSFRKTGTSLPFTDVGENYWAYSEIAWAWENGYMSGTSAVSFNPGSTVSRQQVWMILARMAGENPADMAAAKSWAVANGVSDGTNPGSAVTRQQLAALLYRYAVQNGYDVSIGESTNILSYTDVGQVSEYAIPAMQWACGAGIIAGTGNGSTLSPQGTATRAQLAVMLYRWLA